MRDKQAITYTVFSNVGATTAKKRKQDWPDLVALLEAPPEYRDKEAMPLLSLCRYGSKPTKKGSLRHSGNVRAVHGIEVDYDGGKVSPKEAKKRLEKAKLKGVIYTTPSHTTDKPRWRALLPLSHSVSVDQRRELVAKANQALGGIAARESFAASQSFYFGKVRGKKYECLETHGKCIDRVKLKPLFPKGNGAGGKSPFDAVPDAVLEKAFEKGEGRHDAVMVLSARWIARGTSPEKVKRKLKKLVELSEREPTTTQGENLYKLIERLVGSAEGKFGEAAKETKHEGTDADALSDDAIQDEFGWLDITEVMTDDPKPPEFLVKDWLTLGTVGIFCGHGGTGKSFVALEVSVLIAAGISVFGRDVRQGKVLYISAEDDRQIMNWRLSKILKAHDLKRKDLEGRLIFSDATQADTLLVKPSTKYGGPPKITVRFKRLRQYIREHEPVLIVLDSAVDHFAGSENDRTQVRAFVRKLQKLTRFGAGCSVLLLAHVDAASLKEPEKAKGFSGSTAWPNAARSHWYAIRTGDEVTLYLKKANYSRPGQVTTYKWNDHNGKFDLGTSTGYGGEEHDHSDSVLKAIAELEEEGAKLFPEHVSQGGIVGQVMAHSDCPRKLKAKGRGAVRKVIVGLRKNGMLDLTEAKTKGRHKAKSGVLRLSGKARALLEGLEGDG